MRLLITCLLLSLLPASGASLPKRLVIALDGVAYRDVKSLQEGVSIPGKKGIAVWRQAFTNGYFPVSRLVSTFPSASDVAWTEIFGNRPLPGYQRNYYSRAANRQVSINGLTSSMEYERQVNWRIENRFHFAMSFLRPLTEFGYEVDRMVDDFLHTRVAGENYYALILSSDSAQHMAADIKAMLCMLDERLEDLRAVYRAREGRDLEILILSDHGNNHAGRAHRVRVKRFLEDSGYRISRSLSKPGDVVLPTLGLESWVEIHVAPAETERLVTLLSRLQGVDIVSGRLPGPSPRFFVMNSQGHRAIIEQNPATGALRYLPSAGDPLEYLPAARSLCQKGLMDSGGFASADAWMIETLSHRYPVALERIVHGHTRAALNPATVLISLADDFMHASWLVTAGSKLLKSGGTHGSLADSCSTGILLSNSAPTRDTTASRVASLYEGFPGLRNPRDAGEGAEWISGAGQELVAVNRGSFRWSCVDLPRDNVLLHAWSPRLTASNLTSVIEVSVKPVPAFSGAKVHRWDPGPTQIPERRFRFTPLTSTVDPASSERIYSLPADFILEPRKEYRITGGLEGEAKGEKVFQFNFLTDSLGRPAPF